MITGHRPAHERRAPVERELLGLASSNGVASIIKRNRIRRMTGRAGRLYRRGRPPGRWIEIAIDREVTYAEATRLLQFGVEAMSEGL